MPKFAPDLESKLRKNPNADVNVILRFDSDPAAHLADVQARGLLVRHSYSLISAIAAQGKASQVLALNSESWVVAIEEDKTVHTM